MKYEVYSTENGMVMLAILNDDLSPVAIFDRWETGPRGILADARQQLAEDPSAWEGWDTSVEDLPVAELYADISAHDELIINADGDMMDVSRMGYAVRDALGLPDYDEAAEIAEALRSADTWDMGLARELCEMAGMDEAFDAADGDTFESVIYAAADKLGVEVI